MKVKYTKKNMLYIFTFLIMIIILTFAAVKCVNKFYSTEKVINLNYETKSNIDYKVYLKENNDYSTPYLGPNMKYIASLINYIDFDYNYQLMASDAVDYSYTYFLEAIVNVTDKGNTLYEKQYKLTEPKTNTVKANVININENIKLDYNEYNDLIRNFKKNYSLTSDSEIQVRMNVEIDINYDKFTNKKEKILDYVTSSIPLTEQLVNIAINTNTATKTNSLSETSNHELINYAYAFTALCILIIDVIIIYVLFKYLYSLRPTNYAYMKYLNTILKQYDRYIVNIKKIPSLGKLTIVDVTKFEELLDSRDSLQRPILYKENIAGKKSTFIIINDQEVYRFVASSSQFGKDNEKEKV